MKLFKRIAGFMFAMFISFSGMTKTSAIDDYVIFHDEYLQGVVTMYGAGSTYKEVTTSEGKKIGFCFNMKLDAPPEGSKLVRMPDGVLPNATKTNQYIYILDNGYGGSWNQSIMPGTSNYTKFQKYYVTQLALWIAQGSLNAENVKNYGFLGVQAYKLYNAAVKNSKVIAYEPKVSFSGSFNMKKNGSNYESNTITVKISGAKEATITLTNAPAGSVLKVNGSAKGNQVKVSNGAKLVVTVPVDKMYKEGTIYLNAKATAVRKKVQIYNYQGSNKYQNIGLIFKEKYTAKAKISTTIKPSGGFEVVKVDESGKKLGGAVLAVKDSTGKEIAKWNTSKENPKVFNNLKVGSTYSVYEVSAPAGYKKISDVTVVKINAGEVRKVTIRNFKNTPVKISKQDITNKAELPGATLVLKDSTGKEIDKWVSTNEPHYVTLKEGTYTLSETIAPKGYKLSTETITFNVDANGKADKNVVMYNYPNKPVKISKQDITNSKELPGATLVLKDSTGKEIDKWVSTNEPHYIYNLAKGTYTLSETIAPKGYKLSTETITFTVNEYGEADKDIVMYNAPSKGVYISKQDVATGKELPGATLVLKDADGNIIDKWVSTKKPHYIADLPEGVYTLVETKAPKGYEISDGVITFEIKNDGKDFTKVVIYNSKVPVTDDLNVTLLISTIIVALGAGGFAFFKLKKHA